MSKATHNVIVQMFPGIQDHEVVEILEMDASSEELEAVKLLMLNDDAGLRTVKSQHGGKVNRLLNMLSNSDLLPLEEPHR